MLILTRKTDQGIVFSGNVTIRILSVEGERVKIGIDAPRSVQVLREELVAVPANGNGSGNDHANGASAANDTPNGTENGASGVTSNGTVDAPRNGVHESPATQRRAVS